MNVISLYLGFYTSQTVGGLVDKRIHPLQDWGKLSDPDLSDDTCPWAIAEVWIENATDEDDRVCLKQWMRDT